MVAVRVGQQFELTARPHVMARRSKALSQALRRIGAVRQGHGNAAPISLPNPLRGGRPSKRSPTSSCPSRWWVSPNHHRTLAPAVRPTLGAPLRQPSRRPPVFSTPSACSTRQSCRLPRSRSRRASAACAGSTPSSRTLPSPAGRGQAITPGDARRRHPERSSLPRADCASPTAGKS